MIDLVLFLILMYFLIFYNKCNYVNYQKPFENHKINCPENYSLNYKNYEQREY